MIKKNKYIKKIILSTLVVLFSITFFSVVNADEYGLINLRTERETNCMQI